MLCDLGKVASALCLVASFHDEDFGLNGKLSAAETSSPTHL